MKILALETSTDLASCALLTDSGEVLSSVLPRTRGVEGQHSTTVLPAAKSLLDQAGLTFGQLDAVAFGAGPGAFTGLRMACAAAQGIGVAHDLPLIPVITLETLVVQIRRRVPEARSIIALLDARMGEIYAARYQCESGSSWALIGEIGLHRPETLLFPAPGEILVAGGNVFDEYPVIRQRLQERPDTLLVPGIVPLAEDTVVRAGQVFSESGGIDPALAVPLYVRDRVAKTVAERLAEGGKA